MGNIKTATRPDVTSIVIVNWNTRDLLLACVGSIFQHERSEDVEVIVVDNDSADGSLEAVTKTYPQVIGIASGGNLGYAKACNIGIHRATGGYILILNSDTTLIEPITPKLKAFVKSHPDAFSVGPKLVYPDQLDHQPSCRQFPTPFLWLMFTLRMRRLFPGLFNKFEMTDLNPEQTAKVPQIMGAVMFFEREKLARVGIFDERFWMYLEEVDLCKRGWDAGFANYYYPEIRVTHALSRSAAKLKNTVKMAAVQRSALQYFHKHYGSKAVDRAYMLSIWLVTALFLRLSRAKFAYDWKGEARLAH